MTPGVLYMFLPGDSISWEVIEQRIRDLMCSDGGIQFFPLPSEIAKANALATINGKRNEIGPPLQVMLTTEGIVFDWGQFKITSMQNGMCEFTQYVGTLKELIDVAKAF